MNVENRIKTKEEIPLKQRTLIHLMLVTNDINEKINKTLKPYEISLQQFNVLRILRGQKGKPANLSTLNNRMVTKMSNTTRLVDKLILKGYADRIVCPSNRRKVEISITNEGKKILDDVNIVMKKTEDNILEQFEQDELIQLNELLHKF